MRLLLMRMLSVFFCFTRALLYPSQLLLESREEGRASWSDFIGWLGLGIPPRRGGLYSKKMVKYYKAKKKQK